MYSKRKEFAPIGSKFFPYRVEPFPEGDWSAEKQTDNLKLSPLSKMMENLPGISSPFGYDELFLQ